MKILSCILFVITCIVNLFLIALAMLFMINGLFVLSLIFFIVGILVYFSDSGIPSAFKSLKNELNEESYYYHLILKVMNKRYSLKYKNYISNKKIINIYLNKTK